MNIESTSINFSKDTTKSNPQSNTNSNISFAEELSELKKEEATEKEDTKVEKAEETSAEEKEIKTKEKEDVDSAIKDLNKVVEELNQSDEKKSSEIKKDTISTDNKDMINNDFNIDDKNILPQMNPSMNFNSNGQPFSSFMNEQAQSNKGLAINSADLAEEIAILSTMEENIALANKNNLVQSAEKTIINNEGIKKVDTKTNITIENVVKYDSIIMNEADVEVFTQLVQNGTVDLNNLAPKIAEKGVQVSKTLADMLAKSMENNQPIRINFDNDISVIIRISRDGKITADFLPSSQIAEAYLKENLPLLRQKFDDENIKYDELNQRERKEQHKEQNRKKGRNDE